MAVDNPMNGLDRIREELEASRKAQRDEEAKRVKLRAEYDKAKLAGDKVLQKSLNLSLMNVGKSLANLQKDNASLLTQLSESQTNSLAELTKKFTAEKDAAQFELSTSELDKKIEALNSDANENSLLLRDLFNQAVTTLNNPEISEEERQLAMDQINQIKELASTEEETREAKKLQEDANSLLERMAVGLDSMASSFERFADGFLNKASLLGTLAGLALLLFDPERLKAIIDEIIGFFDGLYDSIVGIINGDWSIAKEFLKDNLKGVGIALGVLALKFGPGILRTIGSISRGIGSIGKFFKTIGKVIGKLPFSKIGGVLKNIFKKLFLPITVILAIFETVKGAIAGFEEGGIIGAIKGALSGLFTSLIGGLLDMIKGAVSWLLGIFGFENAAAALDSFSFSAMFDTVIDKIFSWIGSAVEWIKGVFGFENAAEALNSFSFSELFATVVDKIFSFVGSAIEWIKGVFSNIDIGGMLQSLWDGLVAGAGTIFDIVSAPINAAINWIKGIFTFTTPEVDFSLSEMISNITDKIFEFFSNMFDFLPSFDDIGTKFNSLLPSWLGGEDEEELEEEDTTPCPCRRTLSRRADFVEEDTQGVLGFETPQLETGPQRNPNLVQTAPDTGVLRNTNDMMNNAAAARQANNVAIVNAGTTQRLSNVSNSASTYNISQGVSADDFVRRDFINGY
jgi:hypothetical protein